MSDKAKGIKRQATSQNTMPRPTRPHWALAEVATNAKQKHNESENSPPLERCDFRNNINICYGCSPLLLPLLLLLLLPLLLLLWLLLLMALLRLLLVVIQQLKYLLLRLLLLLLVVQLTCIYWRGPSDKDAAELHTKEKI